MPLANFDSLDAFLDNYLANPPPCYRGVAAGPQVSVIAAAAHTNGAGVSQWVTDVIVSNPGDVEAEVTVHVKRWQSDSVNPEPRTWELMAGHSIELNDVLASEFAIDGNATLRIESDRPVVTVSRTYNDTPSGTFGQFARALPLGHAIGDEIVGHLLMLEDSSRFRTNIGVANLSDHEVSVEVEILDANGASIGADVLNLPPLRSIQRFRMIRDFTTSAVEGARATATSVDNRSGDPVMQIAWPMEDRQETSAGQIFSQHHS